MKLPDELPRTGVRDYSELPFGEGLSRIARHELTVICIKGIQKEQNNDASKKKIRRGRPTSSMGALAITLGVHSDSVRRWMDINLAQACDLNASRLAQIAHGYDPEGVVQVVQADLNRREKVRDAWFKEREANYHATPYAENNPSRPFATLLKDKPDREGPE